MSRVKELLIKYKYLLGFLSVGIIFACLLLYLAVLPGNGSGVVENEQLGLRYLSNDTYKEYKSKVPNTSLNPYGISAVGEFLSSDVENVNKNALVFNVASQPLGDLLTDLGCSVEQKNNSTLTVKGCEHSSFISTYKKILNKNNLTNYKFSLKKTGERLVTLGENHIGPLLSGEDDNVGLLTEYNIYFNDRLFLSSEGLEKLVVLEELLDHENKTIYIDVPNIFMSDIQVKGQVKFSEGSFNLTQAYSDAEFDSYIINSGAEIPTSGDFTLDSSVADVIYLYNMKSENIIPVPFKYATLNKNKFPTLSNSTFYFVHN